MSFQINPYFIQTLMVLTLSLAASAASVNKYAGF